VTLNTGVMMQKTQLCQHINLHLVLFYCMFSQINGGEHKRQERFFKKFSICVKATVIEMGRNSNDTLSPSITELKSIDLLV